MPIYWLGENVVLFLYAGSGGGSSMRDPGGVGVPLSASLPPDCCPPVCRRIGNAAGLPDCLRQFAARLPSTGQACETRGEAEEAEYEEEEEEEEGEG